MTDTVAANEKRKIRSEIREKLRAMTVEERAEKSREASLKIIDRIRALKPESCLLYKALPTEVDVDDVISYCVDNGVAVYLPRVIGEEMELAPLSELKKGAFGILEPLGGASDIVPNIAVTPLVGADKLNNRLGKGKGYYDRYFSGKNIYKIGAAFGCQVVDRLPTDGNDIAMDEIIFA